jgi:hypothetical protein
VSKLQTDSVVSVDGTHMYLCIIIETWRHERGNNKKKISDDSHEQHGQGTKKSIKSHRRKIKVFSSAVAAHSSYSSFLCENYFYHSRHMEDSTSMNGT